MASFKIYEENLNAKPINRKIIVVMMTEEGNAMHNWQVICLK